MFWALKVSVKYVFTVHWTLLSPKIKDSLRSDRFNYIYLKIQLKKATQRETRWVQPSRETELLILESLRQRPRLVTSKCICFGSWCASESPWSISRMAMLNQQKRTWIPWSTAVLDRSTFVPRGTKSAFSVYKHTVLILSEVIQIQFLIISEIFYV